MPKTKTAFITALPSIDGAILLTVYHKKALSRTAGQGFSLSSPWTA